MLVDAVGESETDAVIVRVGVLLADSVGVMLTARETLIVGVAVRVVEAGTLADGVNVAVRVNDLVALLLCEILEVNETVSLRVGVLVDDGVPTGVVLALNDTVEDALIVDDAEADIEADAE